MRWLGHVGDMGDMRNVYKILVGKSEGKKRSRKWKDIKKMFFKGIGRGVVD
jgi:hypothetical protein